MKNSGNWSLRLLATARVVSSAGTAFAADAPGEEHAGYQGIPVRDGLNRGLIQHDDMLVTQRYPSLPRRTNEADFLRAESVDARSQHSSTPDRAGYAGIPQRNGVTTNETQPTETSQPASAKHAGYGGIPQPSAANRVMKRPSTFSAKRASALVNAK